GASLWNRHGTGTNLLFRAEDFASPSTSWLFRELSKSPDATTRALAGHLLLACLGPAEQVPLLEQLARPAAPWAGGNPVGGRPRPGGEGPGGGVPWPAPPRRGGGPPGQ